VDGLMLIFKPMTHLEAAAAPTRAMFVPGEGYFDVGELVPRADPINQPGDCTPDYRALEGQVFMLTGPSGHAKIWMVWSAIAQLWSPVMAGTGNRMAFTPAYLASHGWSLA
jgi:hypothetical protein